MLARKADPLAVSECGDVLKLLLGPFPSCLDSPSFSVVCFSHKSVAHGCYGECTFRLRSKPSKRSSLLRSYWSILGSRSRVPRRPGPEGRRDGAVPRGRPRAPRHARRATRRAPRPGVACRAPRGEDATCKVQRTKYKATTKYSGASWRGRK